MPSAHGCCRQTGIARPLIVWAARFAWGASEGPREGMDPSSKLNHADSPPIREAQKTGSSLHVLSLYHHTKIARCGTWGRRHLNSHLHSFAVSCLLEQCVG